MSQLVLGMIFLVLGGTSIWDARRIASTTRLRGTLDIVGPDGYLLGVGVLLIVVGLLLAIQGIVAVRRRVVPAGGVADANDARTTYSHFALMAVLLAYAIAMPIGGYVVTTLVFFVAVFRIMGVKRWTTNVAASLGLTVPFYLAFTMVADLPLPKGWHGLG